MQSAVQMQKTSYIQSSHSGLIGPLPLPANLAAALHIHSPRYTRPPTPLASLAIHGAVFTLFALLFARAFFAPGLAGWSIGIVYIAYDTFLLAFTFVQTLPLRHAQPAPLSGTRPSLSVIIAAYNEDAVLPGTLAALLAQTDPPDRILIADDGSTDSTASLLQAQFGFLTPPTGGIAFSATHKTLCWLRASHGGKASTLNLALGHVETDLFLTVDADTKLAADAIGAMRGAFAATPGLIAATGVLSPVCGGAKILEWFQTYEYIRNFLGRFAWARADSLLLISGAFAGFNRQAVLTVGGFEPDCMVEDYELIHRLRRYGYEHALNWHSTVLGQARARTSAPATIPAFLRQRRRWFGGFLQTQLWYRDMVGNPGYARLGTWMLPVKAVDTFQPIYGLFAFALLIDYILTGQVARLLPVGGIILGKIIIDLAFHLWSIRLYRRWTGGNTSANMPMAILASILEPFSFQLLRHLGACWGWILFLTGRHSWSPQQRRMPLEES